MPVAVVNSPFGVLGIIEQDGAITGLDWHGQTKGIETDLLHEAVNQMAAYFAGELQNFDLPLRVAGSDFQRSVCEAMLAIPFGETRTYGQIADNLGASAQAVGNGCGGNPIAIIIPCHRVLGADSLGGFSGFGGVETKVALLRHEGAAGLLI